MRQGRLARFRAGGSSVLGRVRRAEVIIFVLRNLAAALIILARLGNIAFPSSSRLDLLCVVYLEVQELRPT